MFLTGIGVIFLGYRDNGFDVKNLDFMSMCLSGILICCIAINLLKGNKNIKFFSILITLLISIYYLCLLKMDTIVTMIAIIILIGIILAILNIICKRGEEN